MNKIGKISPSKYLLLLVSVFIFNLFLFSQNEKITLTIPWDYSQKVTINEIEKIIPIIKNQDYDANRPHFFWKKQVSSKHQHTIKISSIHLTQAETSDLIYLKSEAIEIPNNVLIEAKANNARNEKFLTVSVFPFVMENGILKRISTIEIDVESIPLVPSTISKQFASSSVLGDASSSWYKIKISNDGFYKIDRAFLQSIGINVSSLNPKHINIYGNGSGRLSENNSDPKVDDLAKNSILVVGEEDNSFDENDYIIFYAWGPHKWNQVGINFRRDLNIYSDFSYYYIRISSQETPLRIATAPTPLPNPTEIINSYDYHDIHERELVSIVNSGQRWYGELFDNDLSQNFSFIIPNLILSNPLRFHVSMANNGRNGNNTAIFSVNSSTVFTGNLSTVPIDYFRNEFEFTHLPSSTNIPLTITINRSNPSIMTYLDKIEINARRNLTPLGSQFRFRDLNSVGVGNIGEFSISNFGSNAFVWDLSHRNEPKRINGNLFEGSFTFKTETNTLKEFAYSNGVDFFVPEFVEIVKPQNLHALPQADYLIVTHSLFLSEAEKLANIHRNLGLKVHVVTTGEVYNEFSSGSPDPTAIKWFAKMFYDRAEGIESLMPKYLLLFGNGTYDPKNRISNNTYFVPTYQVLNSENHIASIVTDDYFGLLDDNESISPSDLLDISVGRLIVSNLQQASDQIRKIERYLNVNLSLGPTTNEGSFGDWRLLYTQIADDEDNGHFVEKDAEPQSQHVSENHPEMNVEKIYLDAFVQISTAGGQRYPEVNEAINNRIQRGTLVMNYTGHGGESGAAEERVITIPQINSWNNTDKLTLFVSATCEFTKFDDPSRISAGEWVLLNPNGASIAMMTTTRPIYISVNTELGRRLYENIFLRDGTFKPLSFGEIMTKTKNQSTSSTNKRCFMLIGDPALNLAMPMYRIVTDSINHFSPNDYIDTIQALSKVNIKGHLEDFSGNVLSNFNGILSPTILDKPKKARTLGQDPKSPIIEFETQKNAVFKGKASIKNGYFDFSFIVPKDIDYAYGNGKISYYGHNFKTDAGGYDKRFIIGGLNPNGLNDLVGPEIELFLNDENFVSGGMTDESPKLIAHVFDESGINTVGNGIGHDITVILNQNTANPIVLNDYYISDLDSYQSGKIEYDFKDLEEGKHTLTFKVWDVNNNSSEQSLDFVVVKKQDVTIDKVLNYPNPFTTRTEFFFEHNQVYESLETQIQIFTVTGRLVKTINTLVKTRGFRSEGIEWNGLDDFGDNLGKGVYIYRITIRTPDGETANKLEKLVLLR
jgi:hypothetical protein